VNTAGASKAIRRQRLTPLIGTILVVVLLAALGFSSVFRLFRTAAARAQDSNPAEAAAVADCQTTREAYEKTLPIPEPTPGVPPDIGYVVQLVNETNVTLLAAANAAHANGTGKAISVLPREGTWIMGPMGAPNWPDGTPGNTLTIDIPPGWEHSICGHGTDAAPGCVGPLFWARTGCRYDIAGGFAQCETGTCSSFYDCSANQQSPTGPKAIAEWTFRDNNNNCAPDISVVDGANLNMDIEPIGPGYPNQAPAAFNPAVWMSPENLPLTKCGEDLRSASNCPIGQFQLKRQDQGMFIQGSPGGDDIIGCFSNCGLYEFQGGVETGPTAPCPGFRCPGTPSADCDPTTDPVCYYWHSFCCFALPPPAKSPYGVACSDSNQVPSSQCTQNGICWNADPEAKGSTGTCSCSAFLKNNAGTCPPDVCTVQFSQNPANQPPFNTCENAGATGAQADACIGDDTFHEVMPRGLTWPNDPETYYSNARAYRIVFGPGYFVSAKAGTAPPITPSVPVGLCSDLPPQYGYAANKANCAGEIDAGAVFAGAALAPSCTTLKDPACKVGDTQYDCYLPLGVCATWQCELSGLGGPAHASPPGLINVLCRWSAASPTPTPTAFGSELPTPTAILTPGAGVTSTSVSNVAAPGATVAAGTFTVRNNLKVTESIGSATISVSHPTLFSAMTLNGGGQSKTVTPPAASTTFTFATPIVVPAGGSVTFSLSTVISMHPVMLEGEFKYAGLTPTTSLPITRSAWPLAGGLLILGIALLGLPNGTRRRAIIIAVLALGMAAASAGCGGSSNSISLVASSQRVTAVAVTAGGAPVTVEGVPAALGTITG
jgi:hypothetical protein